MRAIRALAVAFLAVIALCALAPRLVTLSSYETQHRLAANEPPGKAFLLGTDDLGRDRFARLLYGARTSLLLAPAAASVATLIAAFAGLVASCFAPLRALIYFAVDVFVSAPLLFLLLTLRALLPLNTSAWASVCITFALLGLLGWISSVRVFANAAQRVVDSDYVLQARALGSPPLQLFLRQCLPNLMPALFAQFCATVPVFVLAEANLSMLGLGVSEPLPSLGNLMADLLNYAAVIEQPWLLAPAVLLFAVISSLQLLVPKVS